VFVWEDIDAHKDAIDIYIRAGNVLVCIISTCEHASAHICTQATDTHKYIHTHIYTYTQACGTKRGNSATESRHNSSATSNKNAKIQEAGTPHQMLLACMHTLHSRALFLVGRLVGEVVGEGGEVLAMT
jgi:hypothetical protein